MKKKIIAIAMAASLSSYMLIGCDDAESLLGSEETTTSTDSEAGNVILTEAEQNISVEYKEDELVSYSVEAANGGKLVSTSFESVTSGYTLSKDNNSTLNMTDANTIYLNEDSIEYAGSGATVDGSNITITSKGTYILTGTLNNGSIIIDADNEDVELVLANCNITSENSACIYTKAADKTVIVLANETVNTLTDGENYTYTDETNEEPNSCIFSKDDLAITGAGALIVNGNFNNGITGKDDLRILNGYIYVTAKNNGLKGKDCVLVKDGIIVVDATGDGIQASNDTDTAKGYVYIDGGSFEIDSQTKGIKAYTNIIINNGEFNITTIDDGIHSNGYCTINNGNIKIDADDDGIHADTSLVINGGIVDVLESYEGLESENIVINGGDIKVKAQDDGINAAGVNTTSDTTTNNTNTKDTTTKDTTTKATTGESESLDEQHMKGGNGGFGGMGSQMGGQSTGILTINGGNVYVNADGDGLDCNGSVTMTGGTVIVEGPTNSANGSLDYDGSFTVSGGTLLALGASGMAQGPTSDSTICGIITNATTQNTSGTLKIVDSNDSVVFEYECTKNVQNIVFCSETLKENVEYSILLNESEIINFTASGIASNESTGGMFGGGSAPDGGAGGQIPNGERSQMPEDGNMPSGERTTR